MYTLAEFQSNETRKYQFGSKLTKNILFLTLTTQETMVKVNLTSCLEATGLN